MPRRRRRAFQHAAKHRCELAGLRLGRGLSTRIGKLLKDFKGPKMDCVHIVANENGFYRDPSSACFSSDFSTSILAVLNIPWQVSCKRGQLSLRPSQTSSAHHLRPLQTCWHLRCPCFCSATLCSATPVELVGLVGLGFDPHSSICLPPLARSFFLLDFHSPRVDGSRCQVLFLPVSHSPKHLGGSLEPLAVGSLPPRAAYGKKRPQLQPSKDVHALPSGQSALALVLRPYGVHLTQT